MADMVAVTIAIGSEHESLAEIAAERMRCHTGLPVKILRAEDFTESGCTHPNQLKFRLFDLVSAENVLLFDADVFCLRTWNPEKFAGRRDWVAVRGWWFDPWIRRYGTVYGFGEDIFNGGFFICNRTWHEPLLRLAESVQQVRRTFQGLASFDEIALNVARAALGIPICFLDRRFNWIQYGRGNLGGMTDVVMAHACNAQLRQRYLRDPGFTSVSSNHRQSDPTTTEFAGATFIYDRVSYDRRSLTFRADGTIGDGGGDAERFWFVREPDGQLPQLVIGSIYEETCTLTPSADGTWQGNWSNYERMPINLTRHRAQVLIDLLIRLRGRTADLLGVEVGVCQGETAGLLLKGLPNLRLFLVDSWKTSTPDTDYWKTGAGDSRLTQSKLDLAMEQTARRTLFAERRRMLVPCDSAQAAPLLPDDLDFVFIDGDHSYSGVMRDIQSWWPQVGEKGLLTGHDYGNPYFPGVTQAVDEFAQDNNLEVRQGPDLVWYYERKQSAAPSASIFTTSSPQEHLLSTTPLIAASAPL